MDALDLKRVLFKMRECARNLLTIRDADHQEFGGLKRCVWLMSKCGLNGQINLYCFISMKTKLTISSNSVFILWHFSLER